MEGISGKSISQYMIFRPLFSMRQFDSSEVLVLSCLLLPDGLVQRKTPDAPGEKMIHQSGWVRAFIRGDIVFGNIEGTEDRLVVTVAAESLDDHGKTRPCCIPADNGNGLFALGVLAGSDIQTPSLALLGGHIPGLGNKHRFIKDLTGLLESSSQGGEVRFLLFRSWWQCKRLSDGLRAVLETQEEDGGKGAISCQVFSSRRQNHLDKFPRKDRFMATGSTFLGRAIFNHRVTIKSL